MNYELFDGSLRYQRAMLRLEFFVMLWLNIFHCRNYEMHITTGAL